MKCRHCGRSFKHDAALNDHLWAHHPETKLPKKKMEAAYDRAYRAAKRRGASEEQAQEAGMIAFGDAD